MKKLLLALICVGIAGFSYAQSELPETEIKDLNTGKKIAFNQTIEKGKVTLINFWATWCIPCKKEIKNMRLKMDGWKKEADFNYMTISIDESKQEALARTFAVSQGWNFPYYIDPNSDLKRSLNFQNVPFTVIIDKNGKVAYMHSGYEDGGEDEIFAKVKEYASK